ncbi:hypothetical protein HMPREF0216_02580 [Clostridium celatum DSM 1785]|uniref:Uncharacterized protein n=1 Tax=Clostridium celatum DSM 1785 TaxID=545697 RepID=L1QBX3_9CLOT|nr:hypothetical protein HMPREF0216_02580 [Clostridium celatum DSM 1785]
MMTKIKLEQMSYLKKGGITKTNLSVLKNNKSKVIIFLILYKICNTLEY